MDRGEGCIHARARAHTHTLSLSHTRTPPQPLHEQEEALTLALVNETLFFEAAFVDLTASSAPHAPLLDDAVSSWATGKLIETCIALTYTLHPKPQMVGSAHCADLALSKRV